MSMERCRRKLEQAEAKLTFIEEWFENILPNDWSKCMEHWAKRSMPIFDWTCPACGAVLSSSESHCPCREDQWNTSDEY